jgi:hypothetical protein
MTPEQLLQDDRFVAVWGEYLAWRKTMGKRFVVTDRVIRSGLATLAEMGSVDAAVRSLNHCMFAGYRGIFPAPQIRNPAQPFGALPQGPARMAPRPAIQAPRHTPQEELAVEDYKRQAEHLTPSERADLVAKARDTLPAHLVGQLSARVAMLNGRRPVERRSEVGCQKSGVEFISTDKNQTKRTT